MARYYYCPLFLPPSANKPGSTPSRSSYQPGLFDPATGITTSAVAAMVASGEIDFSYRTDNNLGPIGIVLGTMPGRSSGTAPSGMASGGVLAANQVNAPLGTTLIGGFPPSQPYPALYIAPANVGLALSETAWPNVPPVTSRMTIAPNMVPRRLRARNCVFYLDTTSGNALELTVIGVPGVFMGPTIGRMVIETSDAFAALEAPFLANGWALRSPNAVNTDYPFTIQPPLPNSFT